jgi:hypothetical protein
MPNGPKQKRVVRGRTALPSPWSVPSLVHRAGGAPGGIRGAVRASQIEALLAVAQAGSFCGAAASLGVSQSSLSRSVAALEREVGARLLRRPGAPVVPTGAGEAFLAAAPAVLAAVASARSAAGGPS